MRTYGSHKKDDPITLAKYEYDNNLTDKAIWKWSKRYLKNVKKLKCMIRNPKASKQSLRGIKYQFGVRVLQNITEAYKLYKLIGNTLLSDTTKKRGQTTTRQLRIFSHW